MFFKQLVLALHRGFIDGKTSGLVYVLQYPKKFTNVYKLELYHLSKTERKNLKPQYRYKNVYYFETHHLIMMAIGFGLVSGATMSLLAFFELLQASGFLMSLFFPYLSVNSLKVLLASPLSIFCAASSVTALAITIMEGALYLSMELLHATGTFLYHITRPKHWLYSLRTLIDKPFALLVAIPIYLTSKPILQITHSVRTLHRENKRLWRNRNKQPTARNRRYQTKSLLRNTYLNIKAASQIFLNTIAKLIFIPFECIGNIIYAPFQAVQHANKYGLYHVLSYPRHTVNRYDAEGNKKDYAYFFDTKHVYILAGIVGTISGFAGLGSMLSGTFFPHVFFTKMIGVKLSSIGYLTASSLKLATLTFSLSTIVGIALTMTAAMATYLTIQTLHQIGTFIKTGMALISRERELNIFNIFYHEVTMSEPFRTLKRRQALIKTLESDGVQTGESWNFYLQQLANPARIRPVKQLHAHRDRSRLIDLRSDTAYTRQPHIKRGHTQWWPDYRWLWLFYWFPPLLRNFYWIKKTSTTVPPKDGQMHYFEWGLTWALGVMFHSNDCHIPGGAKRPAYCFTGNAVTNGLFWIGGGRSRVKSVPLQTLHDENKADEASRKNRQKRQVSDHNEIMACPTRKSIRALFIPSTKSASRHSYFFSSGLSTTDPADRINVLYRKYLLKIELGVDVPIFIMTAEQPVQAYTPEQQFCDLWAVLIEKQSLYNAENIGGNFVSDIVQKRYGNDVTTFIEEFLHLHTIPRHQLERIMHEAKNRPESCPIASAFITALSNYGITDAVPVSQANNLVYR